MIISAAGNIVLRFTGAGLAFLLNLMIARALDPAEFGEYSIAVSIVSFASIFYALGWQNWITREVSAANTVNNFGYIRGIFRISILSSTILFIFSIPFVLILLHLIDIYDDFYYIFYCISLIMTFNLLRSGFLRGNHMVLRADSPDLIVQPIVIMVFIYFFGSMINVYYALFSFTFGVIISFLVGITFISRAMPTGGASAETVRWHKSLPFWVLSILGLASAQAPLYLAGALGNLKETGLFAVSSAIAGIVTLGLMSINIPLQARLSAAWARGDMVEAQHVVTITSRFGFIAAVISSTVILIFQDVIFNLYGKEYGSAKIALEILIAGQVINAFFGPCRLTLEMTGYERYVIIALVISTIATILVGSAMIPNFGAVGVACSATSGVAVWNVLLAHFSLRYAKISTMAWG